MNTCCAARYVTVTHFSAQYSSPDEQYGQAWSPFMMNVRFLRSKDHFRGMFALSYFVRIAVIVTLLSGAVAALAEEVAAPFALRYHLHIVTTASMRPYVEALNQAFMRHRKGSSPVVETHAARAAVSTFCSGMGANYPDILVLPRRLSHAEFRECQDKNVGDIAEWTLGSEVLVLATRRDLRPFSLTARQLYLAMTAMVPVDGQFLTNTALNWREVDPGLPDVELLLAIPDANQGSRELLNDQVLQAGCRYVPGIRAIYQAEVRTARCLALRRDDIVMERTSESLAEYLKQAPPGTVAILPFHLYEAAGRTLATLPFDGVMPTRPSIEAGQYPLSRRIYLYAKIGHIHHRDGYGVADGMREFLREATSEQVLEPGGIFDRMGLVLPPLSERSRQRLDGLLLRPMIR